MFRKIHSNRDPRDTVFVALRQEFAACFNFLQSKSLLLLRSYPRIAFIGMLLFMCASLLLTLTVYKPEQKGSRVSVVDALKPAQDGIGQVMNQAEAIREHLRLKQEITMLIAKDSLSTSDSADLELAIERLHQLTLKTNPHEPH